jgi:hypothetical protein
MGSFVRGTERREEVLTATTVSISTAVSTSTTVLTSTTLEVLGSLP